MFHSHPGLGEKKRKEEGSRKISYFSLYFHMNYSWFSNRSHHMVKKVSAYIFQRDASCSLFTVVGTHYYCASNKNKREGRKEEKKKVGIWPMCELDEDTVLESELQC